MSVIPYVVEQTVHGERGYDIYSRLLKDRIVFLGGEIDTQVSNLIVAEMLYLTAENGTKDIYLYINSVGGEVTPGMAIYDTMQYINAPVSTICLGQAASLAAVLLAAGRKGKRFALPNSRIMIHQPWGGAQGQATDIEIQAKEILRIKESVSKILASHTGKPLDIVRRDTERDFFMSAEEAAEYGIVDQVISKIGVAGEADPLGKNAQPQ